MSRRHSMENLELMKLTPDKMNVGAAHLYKLLTPLAAKLSRIPTDNFLPALFLPIDSFFLLPFFILVTSPFLCFEGSEVEQWYPDQTVQTHPG